MDYLERGTLLGQNTWSWIPIFAVSALALSTCGGLARADPSPEAATKAYEHAVRCFKVNALTAADLQGRGEARRSASYKAKSEQAFDVALKMGRLAGLTDARMNRDLDSEDEDRRLMLDEAYFKRVASDCEATGLLTRY